MNPSIKENFNQSSPNSFNSKSKGQRVACLMKPMATDDESEL